MIDYQVFTSQEHFDRDGPAFLKRISGFWNWDNKLVLQWSVWKEPRTRSQLNLYREWVRRLADHFSGKASQFTEDEMHDICRHQFLGYEDKVIGHTVISNQLKSTADGKISKSDMSEYMTKVDQWAGEMGCLLPRPDDNEYTKYRDARL